jgi:two-component system OmpR family response regulator
MEKLLIIEDEDLLRQNLRDILLHAGYQVKVAENGDRGIEMARKEMPDLILCDIRMPLKDGYQVLQEVRELPDGLTVGFIFLSAKVEHEDIRNGMNLGADDYLLKPVSRKDLIAAVESRLRVRRQIIDEFNSRLNRSLTDKMHYSEDEVLDILHRLSKSERRIMHYVAQEKSTAEIAQILYISPKTVENHRHNISKKLDLRGGHSVLALALKLKPML